MSYHLVIHRPNHPPRFLGSFTSREEADANRVRLVVDHPTWGRFVRVISGAPRSAPPEPAGLR